MHVWNVHTVRCELRWIFRVQESGTREGTLRIEGKDDPEHDITTCRPAAVDCSSRALNSQSRGIATVCESLRCQPRSVARV